MARHTLTPHRRTLHGTFSTAWEPVLTVDPGDTVLFETLDAGWGLEEHHADTTPRRRFAPRDPERDNGHALCGPVEVNGAEPGMTLVVDVGPIRTGAWGWTVAGGWTNGINEHVGLAQEEFLMRWDLDAGSGLGTNHLGHTVELAPFFGVMGMPAADPTPIPSWTPRPQGGNLDCRELGEGATLYLPIAVPGAYFSAGDGHALQADGEVSSTGIECPIASGELTLSLTNDLALTTPMARTPDAWLTFGFDESLDAATLLALDAMLVFCRETGVGRHEALALASLLADFRITQIVNGVRGVHALIRHDALARLGASAGV
ncbi:MAG: acetamidase/formamidase family protein [Chloroflexia bacterium]|nr:acetamidase/formamidase family protein [Chloroflexia bacterium]